MVAESGMRILNDIFRTICLRSGGHFMSSALPSTLNPQPSTLNPLPTKSAFTLIELLIVTVVILALMGVMFRLTGVVGGASARETTVYRMQCLENCLSGYYAAFGSYPPVPLQGTSRNIFRRTDSNTPWIQSDDPSDVDDGLTAFKEYNSVEAACRSQPVAARFPPPSTMQDPNDHNRTKSSYDIYSAYQTAVQTALSDGLYSSEDETKIRNWANRTLEDISGRPGFLNSYEDTTSANKLQLFRFGLMSFLLPRYRFMLSCAAGSQGSNGTEAFNNAIDSFKQWTDFNSMPPRMDSGISYASWKDFCDTFNGNDDWQIDLIPSQAACARWMPNLRDIVTGPQMKFFGVYVGQSSAGGTPRVSEAAKFSLYFPGGYNGGSSSRGYPLLSYTVKDGWSNEFYYYSPAPYQTYVLWSAGANCKTFPPWVDLEQFKNDHRDMYDVAIEWMADDVKHMSTGK